MNNPEDMTIAQMADEMERLDAHEDHARADAILVALIQRIATGDIRPDALRILIAYEELPKWFE